MQKNKENLFREKFRLLNSQEHTEDINWSCSDSSDFENVSNNERFCNLSNKAQTRKRKRKKKVPKNISNLDITILDVAKDVKEVESRKISPILHRKNCFENAQKSPVFAPVPLYFPPYKCTKVEPSSPILTSKVTEQHSKPNVNNKSPILQFKYRSPKASPKVKKKLFEVVESRQEIKQEYDEQDSQHISLVIIGESDEDLLLDRRKSDSYTNNHNIAKPKYKSNKNGILKTNDEQIEIEISSEEIKIENDFEESNVAKLKSKENSINQENEEDDSFKMLKTENIDLVKRVKSYFDSHFGSETTSQHSISDCVTQQNSKTSDEIDIISFVTQVKSNRPSSQSEQEALSKNASPISSQSAEINEKPKKIRYKKYGLAFRLNNILKKQNANISLWQHERFLAENSNFVIPKGEHLVFQIQKVDFKYGCYLLEVVDINNSDFIILINSNYVDNTNFTQNMILKLYEPYKIVDFKEDCKLIINACKFESISLSQ